MKTIIMAGGFGTRISTLFPNIPKPLIPISGTPVLEREICSLRDQGFTDIILTVSYLADKIISYFGNGSRLGVKIEYFVEKTPLGNAGALFKLRDVIGNNDFLLLNADAIFDVDFNRMVRYHQEQKALVTLFTHSNSHPYDSSLIIADEENRVVKWLSKEDKRPNWYKNKVNAGLHVINPSILYNANINNVDIAKVVKNDENGKTIKIDLDRQLLKPLSDSGQIFCYNSPEYVKDMGTPERYASVVKDFECGIITKKNLKNKQRAIFLDRDGTINKYVGFLHSIDDFELLSGVAEAIKIINLTSYLAIVVTNQPVIARGEVSYDELKLIHNKMETLLGLEGAYIDGLYFCPHHPHKGYEGEVAELKIDCECRKPKAGMLNRASIDFNIDLKNSWMIGDSENDIKAGKNAGCKTMLINSKTYKDFGQDLSAGSLLEAINKIFDHL